MTTLSKISCSQTGDILHSNFTWRIRSWKSHEKVFIRIYPHFLLWFPQLQSRKPSRHPEPLTLLQFFPSTYSSIHASIKKSHHIIAWPRFRPICRTLLFPTHYWMNLLACVLGRRRFCWLRNVRTPLSPVPIRFPRWFSQATLNDCLGMFPASMWIRFLPFTQSQLIPSLWQYQDIHIWQQSQLINLLQWLAVFWQEK